jgi:hypothetical protein
MRMSAPGMFVIGAVSALASGGTIEVAPASRRQRR